MFTKQEIDTRTEVLKYSLMIENLLSIFLAEILGIKDAKKSKILGNMGGTLSFNQKVQLLIEIEALDASSAAKYITFMEVRNQFIHNLEADTYEKCFSFIKGKSIYLLKQYPPTDKAASPEIQLKNAFKKLSSELMDLTSGLLDKVKEKISNQVRHKMLQEFQDHALLAIKEIEQLFGSYYAQAIEKGQQHIDIGEVKQFGPMVNRIFYRTVLGKMKKTVPAK